MDFENLIIKGKKNFTTQLFVSIILMELMPTDNYYPNSICILSTKP